MQDGYNRCFEPLRLHVKKYIQPNLETVLYKNYRFEKFNGLHKLILSTKMGSVKTVTKLFERIP